MAVAFSCTFIFRENDRKVQHTYAFQSEKCKLDWLNNLRYAKLKLSESPVTTVCMYVLP